MLWSGKVLSLVGPVSVKSDTKSLARQIMHTTITWSLWENPRRAHLASWRANTERSSLRCLSWSLLFTGY